MITPQSTGWNDKIVVLKKITLRLYLKFFIDLYTTGQLVDGLQQKKKTGFH